MVDLNMLSGRWSRAGVVAALIAVTVAITLPMRVLAVPAALLLGPLVAGAFFGMRGARVAIPQAMSLAAQAVVGCLVAVALTRPALVLIGRRWPLFLAMGVAVLIFSSVTSWAMARMRWIPGSTAVWGLAPGASAAMVAMAQQSDADPRLVAVMQYMRILLVSAAAIGVAAAFATAGPTRPPAPTHGSTGLAALATTLFLVAAGTAAGVKLPVPGLPILLPAFGGAALVDSGVASVALPGTLLALAYATVGWSIGLKFDAALIRHCARIAPRLLAATAVLLTSCAALSLPVAWLAGVDPLTAYLSTSPGGIDAITVIAASSPVDLDFILPAQIVRFLLVLVVGPKLARWIAAKVTHEGSEEISDEAPTRRR